MEIALRTGLCYEKEEDGSLRDRFWGRVIFPWFNVSGKILGFGGRVLDSRTKGVSQKYVNSPESEIYSKRRELYGIYQAKAAIVKKDCVYMVEGYTDVIAMHQCGLENVVANSGTALSEDQIRLLHRFTSNITLLYDGDEAGLKASIRGIDMLLAEGMNIKVLLLPDGEDPDSYARKHNATEFQQYITDHEEDFIHFKTNLLLKDTKNDPIKRAALISDMAQSIGLIPNEVVRYACLRECADILNVDERVIKNEIDKIVRQRKDEFLERRMKEKEEAEKVNDESSIPPPPFPPEEWTAAPVPEPQPLQTAWSQSPSYGKELELVKMLIRYGERIVCYLEAEEGEEGEEHVPVTVTEYISLDLKQDELQFNHPLHRKILEEAEAHLDSEGFLAERYFLSHPDAQIARMAADMLNERYQLSKSNEEAQTKDDDRLHELIPHLLIDFKLSILEEDMKQTIQQLSNPDVAKNAQKSMEVMKHYKELTDTLKEMAKRAGDRVILKA